MHRQHHAFLVENHGKNKEEVRGWPQLLTMKWWTKLLWWKYRRVNIFFPIYIIPTQILSISLRYQIKGELFWNSWINFQNMSCKITLRLLEIADRSFSTEFLIKLMKILSLDINITLLIFWKLRTLPRQSKNG